ncbi:hypothetical protein IFR05_008922, partial [Cadophora sp. M221]
PHNSTVPKPPNLQDWTYIGCLASPTSSFPSFILATQNENMTIRFCASSCGSSAYLGTFSTSCYCGSELTDTLPMSDTQCTTPCPGSSTQSCGGSKTNININTKDKRSGHDHPLEIRQGTGYLLTVYQNQALLPNFVIPSCSQAIIVNPTPNPSEVHFAPTTGEIPTPTISLVPVSTLIGVPMGRSADPTSVTSWVTFTSLPTGIQDSVENLTTSVGPRVSPAATYTDLCGCAASTLQAFTIASTLTIISCGCKATGSAHAHSPSPLQSHEIPMTTITRICADCGIDGKVIVTVPCTEPILLPLTPSPVVKTEIANTQAVGAEPQTTHVKIETVTVLPQPANVSVSGLGTGSRRGNETMPVSNRAGGVGLQ